jgi:phthalate 4,5-dioxygenase oxygenase subunit
MLSHEDNEKLVRVGKGTPLGELFRLYWIPFLPSKDLMRDGQPRRIRLLGEDLVTSGTAKAGLALSTRPARIAVRR